MSILDLNDVVQGIIAGAGISELVMDLLLQRSLSNIISGFVVSFRNQLSAEEWMETTEYSGEVMEISRDKFILKPAGNHPVIIPNKNIIDSPMKKYSFTSRMGIVLHCGVGYKSDLRLVKNICNKAIGNLFEQK
jgi:small conductance mechanosensitive channel